jgi:hypothetical protein
MAKKYHQGIFKPKNPEKYVGDSSNIFYRSSWELKFMIFADTNPNVLKYASEEIAIPYYSNVDHKMHRYFPDFLVQIKTSNGSIKKLMIEVKPSAETVPPVVKKNTKKYLTELAKYSVNSSKWSAAEAYCLKNGMEFLIMTEQHLYNK